MPRNAGLVRRARRDTPGFFARIVVRVNPRRDGCQCTIVASVNQEEKSAGGTTPWKSLTFEELEARVAALPVRPGCYVFRDGKGKVLYVGKAKSLRSRVRSYFQTSSGDDRPFLPLLRRLVGGLETFVTQTEKEAAILENSLIKESRPRFNIKLRDDKEFLTLRLDPNQAWPRLHWVRRPAADRARYFGPYHSASLARRTLQLVEKQFQLRTCTDREMKSRSRPCLQHQIKRCAAPCVYEVDENLYAEQVRAVTLFLEGRHDELTAQLTRRMQGASEALEFELAASYRDQLQAIESVRQKQRVVAVTERNQDVVGLYRQGDIVEIAVLYLRAGRMVQVATFSQARMELPDREIIAGYLREHYGEEGLGANVPDEVLVPVLPDGGEGVAEWLSERRLGEGRGVRAVKLLCPSRGPRSQLLTMAADNAQHAFEEKRRAKQDVGERLAKVQEKLRLPSLPREIECIDISHMAGQDTFGSIVALSGGEPNKKKYRTFHVKTAGPADDYGAIYEVLSRRFLRATSAAKASGDKVDLDSSDSAWSLPDLLVVDGGRGQLAVALAAAADLGLHDLSLVGLAKERENAQGTTVVERIYLPGQKNPVTLGAHAPELFLLALARDEAHRFANRSRARAGKRRRLSSPLDAVPGIGPKTRSLLQRNLGGVESIRAASDSQLLAIVGIGPSQVRLLRDHLGVPESEPSPLESSRNQAPDVPSGQKP